MTGFCRGLACQTSWAHPVSSKSVMFFRLQWWLTHLKVEVISSGWPVQDLRSAVTQCWRDRLGPALGHQEACRKALEHSRRVEPLRRAATVSLWATWSEPRSKTLEHSRITQLLRRAATGHKLTLAVPRSSSAILGCSNTFMHASRWLRTCPKLSHRRWVT